MICINTFYKSSTIAASSQLLAFSPQPHTPLVPLPPVGPPRFISLLPIIRMFCLCQRTGELAKCIYDETKSKQILYARENIFQTLFRSHVWLSVFGIVLSIWYSVCFPIVRLFGFSSFNLPFSSVWFQTVFNCNLMAVEVTLSSHREHFR